MESFVLQAFGERPWASRQIARRKVCWQLAKRRRNYSERAGISFGLVLKGVQRTGFGESLQSPSQSILLGHFRRGILTSIANSGQNILHYNTPYPCTVYSKQTPSASSDQVRLSLGSGFPDCFSFQSLLGNMPCKFSIVIILYEGCSVEFHSFFSLANIFIPQRMFRAFTPTKIRHSLASIKTSKPDMQHFC